MRYECTDKIIENALLKLLEEKDINHITIQELCKIVKINRSTFYAHYQDIYSLLDKIDNKLSMELIKRFEKNSFSYSDVDFIKYINLFLEFASENKVFYMNFVNSQQKFPISRGFDKLYNSFVVPYYESKGIYSENEIMYHFVFIQAGFTMVLKKWLINDCKDSHEVMADIIFRCIFK